MTRPLEITLGDSLKRFAVVYVDTFHLSFAKYGTDAANYTDWLQAYSKLIEERFPELCRMSAKNINSYLNLYGIHVNKSADEFKLIYFLGRAIEAHLRKDGLVELAQVHLFTMVGLLDYKIRTLGYEKKILVKALLKLIRLEKLYEELGPTGCYLVYKSASTSVRTVPSSSTSLLAELRGQAAR